MSNLQKNFLKVILVVVVILAGVLGYVTLRKESTAPSLNAPIAITSPRTGSKISQGKDLNISWESKNFPENANVALFLLNAQNGSSLDIISHDQPGNGSYT